MLKLTNFEGPLDLLLQLIDQEELNISTVSLSQVTEQYFSYLDKLEKNRSNELADFLVIATRLIYLKSRSLLPYLYPEEDNSPSLADQLRMYKAYVDAGVSIQNLWDQTIIAYGRNEPPIKMKKFIAPNNAQSKDLHNSFIKLLNKLKPVKPLPETTIDHTVSVKQTIDRIWSWLKKSKKFSFKKYIGESKNRTELIVSFLALLDLLKEKDIIIRQVNSFDDMEIERNKL